MLLYQVMVDDIYIHHDSEAQVIAGVFTSYQEAETLAKAIIDSFLLNNHTDAMYWQQLFSFYLECGVDPFIVPEQDLSAFNAHIYAKQKCRELCEQTQA